MLHILHLFKFGFVQLIIRLHSDANIIHLLPYITRPIDSESEAIFVHAVIVEESKGRLASCLIALVYM